MMRNLLVAALAVVAVGATGPAWALDIHNTDNRDYEVTIITGDEENAYTFTLPAGGEESAVCTDCKISVEGVGTIDAAGVKKVEIVGGKFKM
ncbi:MAG: hypothetical protein OEN55_04615 [Alphaproteobacteria bacterium]|nr:hypothetical protein [Alphaproteobacteria bacterium]